MYNWVRFAISAVLLVSAILKFTTFQTLIHSDGLLSSPLRVAVAVAMELAAIVLIGLTPRKISWLLATGLFLVFVFVATWTWWTGTNCNCFGASTPKGLPLLVDLVCLTALAMTRPKRDRDVTSDEPKQGKMFAKPVALAVVAALIGGAATYWSPVFSDSDDAIPDWFGNNLIGKRFPLLGQAVVAQAIPAQGNALLVVLRNDCDHCRELAEEWDSRHAPLASNTTVVGIVIQNGEWVLTPGHILVESDFNSGDFSLSWPNDSEPFVAAPTLIAIHNQVVIAVKSSAEVDVLLAQKDWVDILFEGVIE